MKKESYVFSGRVNSHAIENKTFKTKNDALRYLDNLCTRLDLEVIDEFTLNSTETYIIDHYNRFSITKVSA